MKRTASSPPSLFDVEPPVVVNPAANVVSSVVAPVASQTAQVPRELDVLHGLNPAQREAVTHDVGPLIVLAGPGTGKTRVIVHRVADLITRRAAPASSILAVTFTIKAAEEMRTRLAGVLANAPAAQAVRVHTFHALGMTILRRFGDMLDLGPRMKLIDEVQRRRLMMELIEQHSLFGSARAAGLASAAEHAASAFERMANHAVEPAEAERRAAQWVVDARNSKLFAAEREGEIARAEMFQETARLYALTRDACIERAWLTFEDLISMPIRLLRDHPRAAAIIRSELRHIVVDEFQDMNPAQIEFLRQLAPPGTSRDTQPDVCVVGDDDQAIYGFRGADDRAFEHFASAFPSHRVIRLEENYRSGSRIIGVANAIIAGASRRFDSTKVIRQGTRLADTAPAEGLVQCVNLKDDNHSGSVIASLIRAAQQSDPNVRLSSFAVVAKSHTQLERVGATLEMEGIATRRLRVMGRLEEPGVQVVLAWAAAMLNDRDWAGIRPLLLHAPISMPPDAVLALEHRFAACVSRVEAGEPDATDPGPYLAWLLTQPESVITLQRVVTEINALAALSPSLSASETLRRIIQTSAIADAALLDARARAQRVTALVTLLRYAADRQERLRPPGDLRSFIDDYLEDIRSGGGDDSGALDASDMVDGHESTAETQRDEVLLVTAHSAKGLEFDTVFVPGVSPRAKWPGTTNGEATAIATPPNLCGQEQTDEQVAADAIDEQRRLFYVACTRARQRLVILSQRNKSRSKKTNFYEEVALDEPSARLVSIIDQDAALALSAMTPPSAWDRAIDLDARQARRELIYRLRQRARQEAAAAFDALEAADDWSQQLPGVVDTLERSAARIAALSAISRGEPASAIASALARSTSDAATADVAALVARLQAHTDLTSGQSAGVALHTSVQQLFATRGLIPTRVRPPLRLSYTMIDAYRRCPMCFFLRYVLGIPEEEREATEIGSVAHAALERFYRLWSAADADGVARPGKSDLIAIARKLFFQSLPDEARADKALLGMLIAQLELLYDRLHDENAHVLEIERQVRMTFHHAGFDHTIDAKIDRVDRDEHGLRIIDYKTGKAWKKLLEPARDDLQLGLYAMALDQLYADDPSPNIGDSTPSPRSNPGTPPAQPAAIAGHAEYWVLSIGQRGSIALDQLNRPKIDNDIRAVIDGILGGDWTPKARCAGLCALFRA